MDLRDTTNYLLRAHDVGHWIRLADTYMQSYNKLRSLFVLPAEHSILKPIIEAFASDTTAFATYIRALRDASTGSAYDELHDLYRTISVRAMQVTRRSRIRMAVLLLHPQLATHLGRTLSYDEQIIVGKKIEQIWGAKRLAVMAKERSELKAARLPSETRAMVLDAFWKEIDKGLDAGVVDLDGHSIEDLLSEIQR